MANQKTYRLFLLILAAFSGQCTFSQEAMTRKEIHPDHYLSQKDSLAKHFGARKKLPSHFELPCLIALSHYPELKNTKIVFVRKSIRTTGASFPKWTFIFKRKENRVYNIYLNNNPRRLKGGILEDVPFNAQIGLIGHEIGHVADYRAMGSLQIMALGIKYFFIRGRVTVENRVDSITICHNLGWQLYDFDDFIFNRSTVPETYKNYKRKVYYKPEELLGLMKRNEAYQKK